MDKIIYIRDYNDETKNEGIQIKEPTKLQFEFSSDLTLEELRIIFLRISSSLGYNENHIKRLLGTDDRLPGGKRISEIR